MKPPEDHSGGELSATDSECQVLAALLGDDDKLKAVLLQELPSAEVFADKDRRTCWQAALDVAKAGEPVIYASVLKRLKLNGASDPTTLMSLFMGSRHAIINERFAGWHADQVRVAFVRRETVTTLEQAVLRSSVDAVNPDELSDYLIAQGRRLKAVSGASQKESLAACLLPASQLATMTIPKRPRLLDRWLCEADLGFVFAARGVGKTWLSMALPAAISQGKALGLWEAGEARTRILYVDGEMPLELTQYRSRGMRLGDGDVSYLHHEQMFERFGSSLNIGIDQHRNDITDLVVSEGFKMLVLDNLSCLASGIDENKGDAYEPIKHWLLELRRRKVTVIVVHHAGRNTLMRGHSKREDDCSWIISLTDAKRDGEPGAKFITHFAKPSRNTGDSMPDLLWHFTTDEKGDVSIQCERSETSEYEAFIQHVLAGVESQADIAEMMGKNKGTISKWAKKAEMEGRIKKAGGKLQPPDEAKRYRSYHGKEDADDDL